MTQPINCRCGGEASITERKDILFEIKCLDCNEGVISPFKFRAIDIWNRVMAEPQRVSQQDIAGVIMRWDSIIADKELADDMAMAIYELVYGEGEK